MNKIARFEKVSYEQFKKDFIETYHKNDNTIDDKYIRYIYDNIKLPKRATSGSAGYDFYSPISFNITSGDNFVFPTGIKAYMDEGWVLTVHMRSSLGFKYGVSLSNTTGIIDRDYYNNENNEGHIFVKLSNNDKSFNKTLTVINGQAVCQGIFLPFGITIDDETNDIRIGGIGSTN